MTGGDGEQSPIKRHLITDDDEVQQVAMEIPAIVGSPAHAKQMELEAEKAASVPKRRAAVAIDQEMVEQAELEMKANHQNLKDFYEKDEDKERRRRMLAEKKARDDEHKRQEAEWEAMSHKKIYEEEMEKWKKASRQYSRDFAPEMKGPRRARTQPNLVQSGTASQTENDEDGSPTDTS